MELAHPAPATDVAPALEGAGAPAPTQDAPTGDLLVGLGIEVARDRVRLVLVDAHGVIRARAERRDVAANPTARARAAASLAHTAGEDVEARLGAGRHVVVRHAVASFPAVVSPDGASVYHLPGFEKGGTALRDAFVDALGCPVTVENDINLCAVAEQHHGAGRGADSFVTLVIGSGSGTGFGAGLVLDGRLHRGASGFAGEVGVLPQPGLSLGSQVLGEVALSALLRERGLDDSLRITELLVSAVAGDEIATDVVDQVARRLAITVANVALVLDPGLFVLGDAAAHPEIFDRVSRYLREQVSLLPLRVEASALAGDGVVLGAARLASERLR